MSNEPPRGRTDAPSAKCPYCNHSGSPLGKKHTVASRHPLTLRCWNCGHEFPLTHATKIDEATGLTYAEITARKSLEWWRG
jgi:hypothetical protein